MKRFNCDFGSRFRILKGGKISLVVSAILSSTTLVFAAPTGGVVTSGTANISQSGNTTNITQSTNKATINWQDFSIKSNETVNFNQPNVNSITLNRVVGNERSIIDGALNSNGQVWILNSNGILFNSNAKINTAGILATTKNITDADFNAGNYKFTGDSTAGVINMGKIEASDSGYVALLANTVQNDGTIKAYKGTVHLTGASEATINLNGNSIVSLTVNKGVLDALVENKGAVLADGGKIYLTTNAVDEILKGVVNNTGLIDANSLDDISGHVELFAHGGTANVSGTIEAIGGFVETSGRKLQIDATAKIQADTWLLDPINVTIEESGNLIDYPDGEGEKSNNGSTVSASAIMAALATTDVIITTTGDGTDEGNIYVNSSITYGGTHGLYLKAYNDININADITVNDTARLYLQYGWDGGNSYGNRGGINLKMNADHTTFDAKVTLNDTSKFYSVTDAGGVSAEYTVIRDSAGLSAIDSNYAFYKMLPVGHPSRPTESVVEASLSGKYVLGGDIDLSAYNWKTIGGGDYTFTGVFNGLGHTIDGMKIDDTVETFGKGLFTGVYGASVSNLALTHVDIEGNGAFYGTLASYILEATISNIIVEGSIKGTHEYGNYGGLVSQVMGESIIDNVHADVDIEGSTNLGGLVGYGQANLTITNSSSKGDIKFSKDYAGGLIGNYTSANLKIENSFNSGNVSAIANTDGNLIATYAGGLVGYLDSGSDYFGNTYPASGNIKESFNTGNIAGNTNIGGLFGFIGASTFIENSFNTGDITAVGTNAGFLGGFIGNAKNVTLNNTYNSGKVDAQGGSDIGGFIGGVSGNEIEISNSFTRSNVNKFIGSTYNESDVTLTNISTGDISSTLTFEENAIFDTFAEPTWLRNSTINNGLPYLSWHELASTPVPEPMPTPVPNPTQNPNIEKVITTIVNNTINNVNLPKDILLPKVNPVQNMPILPMTSNVQSSPMMQNIAQKLAVNEGEQLSLVSTAIQGQSTERITLGELKNLSEASNDSNEGINTPIETRVALGDNSIIELVNGGVSLPEGVDQEFYVVKNKKNKK